MTYRTKYLRLFRNIPRGSGEQSYRGANDKVLTDTTPHPNVPSNHHEHRENPVRKEYLIDTAVPATAREIEFPIARLGKR